MTLILISVLALLIILCWILNQAFLEKFYQRSKVNSLKESYQRVNELSAADTEPDDEYYDKIERIEANYNVNVYIISEINTFMGRMGFKYLYPISADVDDFGSFSIFRNDRFDRIGNAIQHSQNGTKAEIKIIRNDKDLMFSVEDNGIGLEKEDCDKLFNRFSQGTKQKRSASTLQRPYSTVQERKILWIPWIWQTTTLTEPGKNLKQNTKTNFFRKFWNISMKTEITESFGRVFL